MGRACRIVVVSSFLVAFSCGSPCSRPDAPCKKVASATPPAQEAFQEAARVYYEGYLEAHPHRAVRLGYHEYDGRLPDVSEEGLTDEVNRLKQFLATFEAMDAGQLDDLARVEHGVLVYSIRAELFRLDRQRSPWRDPMFYMGPLDLTPYVAREYGPVEKRAMGVIGVAEAAGEYLETAEGNLEDGLPRPWVVTALMMVRGAEGFVRDDVQEVLGVDPGSELGKKLAGALDEMAEALEAYEQVLQERLEHATQDYALGEETFVAMLAETQGFDVDLERLERMGREDLERNLAAMEQAAGEIDPDRPVAEVVEEVMNDRPAPEMVLQEAGTQASQMRQFLIDHDIVTIPSDEVAEVRETPPFKRWNAAMLDGPGPFEKKKMPSFYYISPPDPQWPEEQQKAYIPGRMDLLFITIHELWPGHFLHGLHMRQSSSVILRSFWNYAMGEGWAHYTEEMMYDQGAGDQDPRAHIGQLANALLRDVRFLSAIGLHARSMTVEESAELFSEKAFCDPGNAMQQARRGTFDPMYLAYTLGKLAILEIREDYRDQEGDGYTLKGFHDELLSYGAAPLPVIRAEMLGPDAGPPLAN